MKIVAYTDGACVPNPGTGGWAAILFYRDDDKVQKITIAGNKKKTTNNRMEMEAVLKALEEAEEKSSIHIFSDSKYVINGFGSWKNGKPTIEGWSVNWKKNGWVNNKNKKTVLNKDMWIKLHKQTKRHKIIKLSFVKGHDGHKWNEECDKLAVEARLYNGRFNHRETSTLSMGKPPIQD